MTAYAGGFAGSGPPYMGLKNYGSNEATTGLAALPKLEKRMFCGPLKEEGVEEIGIGHLFERAMITTIMTSRFARTYWAVLQRTMTTNETGSHMVKSCQKG